MLSSLALKVNLENTTQSLENAWKELNEYLIQNGRKSISADDFEMDFGIDEFNGLIDELKNNNAVEQSSWRMLTKPWLVIAQQQKVKKKRRKEESCRVQTALLATIQ